MNRGLASLVSLVALAQGCGGEPVVATPVGSEPSATPPPVSGGTLVISGDFAVAADPTVDMLFIVDLAGAELVREVAFAPGDEPGRVVKGGEGDVFVVLRRAGELARVHLGDGAVSRAPVCAAPRGVDYDEIGQRVYVACAGGELVTMNSSLEVISTLPLERDLRDVLYVGGKLVVSRFRSAEVLVVDPVLGRTEARARPESYLSVNFGRQFEPAVAWRMQELPNGDVAVVHQRALADAVPASAPIAPGQGSYSGGTGMCDEVIVHAAVTVFSPEAPDAPVTAPNAGGLGPVALPVDIAISPNGSRFAVVGAANDALFESELSWIQANDGLASCFIAPPEQGGTIPSIPGEPVAVAFDDAGALVVQTRQPAAIHLRAHGEVVELPGPSRRHVGHAMFHRAASPVSPLACASCHPEGREDGRVWMFSDVGARRTQDVSGGLLSTKPFHWDGAFDDLHVFMSEIFVNRMGGSVVPEDRIASLEGWLDALAHVPASLWGDSAAVARGEELFFSAALDCASCHNGAKYTNNTTVEVGTGQLLQVPSLLGLWSRAPYMHDGCAATLHDRFTATSSCGGGDFHGKTSQLGEAEVSDLVAYLETL